MIPIIPYKIVSTVRVGGAVRQETRNAGTLAQASDIAERESRKPLTRHVEIWVCLSAVDRRGGPDARPQESMRDARDTGKSRAGVADTREV